MKIVILPLCGLLLFGLGCGQAIIEAEPAAEAISGRPEAGTVDVGFRRADRDTGVAPTPDTGVTTPDDTGVMRTTDTGITPPSDTGTMPPLDAGFTDAAMADAQTTDSGASGGGPRPTGTLALTSMPCQGNRGDVCYSMTISCAGIANLSGSLAITTPNGTPRGTVVLHKGGGGTSFLDMGFVNALESVGYRVVQLRYSSDWEQESNLGMVAAGCRPATVFREVARMFTGGPTCLVGFSGGSGAIGFAMAHYGLENEVNLRVVGRGPALWAHRLRLCTEPVFGSSA